MANRAYIDELIEKEIGNTLSRGRNMVENLMQSNYPYESIQDYTARTGKRYRVSKGQKERISAGELTREQAFYEFMEESSQGSQHNVQNDR